MSAAARPRAAIVGAGLMGRWHAHALRRLGVPLAAVVDPDSERARRLAAAYPGAVPYRSLAAVLADGGAEVVHVCTPLETHVDLAREAMEAGAHVLVEKPLAASTDETQALYGIARERNRLLCPIHQMPFQPGVMALERRITRLGLLHHVEATLCSAGGEGRPAAELDRIAGEILPHPLSLFLRLLPVPLCEWDWALRRPAPGELRLLGSARGISASILVSMGARPPVHTVRVYGAGGTAHLDLFHGYLVVESGRVSRARKIVRPFSLTGATLAAASWNLASRALRAEPAYPGLTELLRRFYRAVRGEGPVPIGAEEALAVARLSESIAGPAPGSLGGACTR